MDLTPGQTYHVHDDCSFRGHGPLEETSEGVMTIRGDSPVFFLRPGETLTVISVTTTGKEGPYGRKSNVLVRVLLHGLCSVGMAWAYGLTSATLELRE